MVGVQPKQSINSVQVVKRRRDGPGNGLSEMKEKKDRERVVNDMTGGQCLRGGIVYVKISTKLHSFKVD